MGISRNEINVLLAIKKSFCTIEELASKEAVTPRNIRYMIDNINYYLGSCNLEKIEINKSNVSCNLSNYDIKHFMKIISKENYIFSRAERKEFILALYLFSESITITKICRILKVSRQTVSKDINEIALEIIEHDLFFEIKNRKLVINGNEKKLRNLKVIKLYKYINNISSLEYYIYMSILHNNNIFLESIYNDNKGGIEEYITKIEKELDIILLDNFRLILSLYLIIAKDRVIKGNIIKRKANEKHLIKMQEFKIIEKILDEYISKEHRYEHLHFTEYFISGHKNHSIFEYKEEIEVFTKSILEEIDIKLNILTESSSNLKSQIENYLTAAIYRIKNNFFLSVDDVINCENKIYKIVLEACKSNNHMLFEPLRSEEIYSIYIIIRRELVKMDNKSKLQIILDIAKKNSLSLDEKSFIREMKESFYEFD